jgi:hypothetical protein
MVVLVLVAGVLVGCGGSDNTTADEGATGGGPEATAQALAEGAGSETYVSAALDASYEGALPASSQLALGTLELKETANAVTPEQAASLLPLWQAIQAGTLQSEAETNAVLKQIEKAMTAEQLAAIASMQLTFEDMGTWVQAQGVNFAPPQGAAGGQNPAGAPGNLSDEERAAMRATAQAGGGPPGLSGPSGNLSDEERTAMRATAEAGGMTFGNRGGGASLGQLGIMAQQVVDLLNQVAAE